MEYKLIISSSFDEISKSLIGEIIKGMAITQDGLLILTSSGKVLKIVPKKEGWEDGVEIGIGRTLYPIDEFFLGIINREELSKRTDEAQKKYNIEREKREFNTFLRLKKKYDK